MYDQHEMRRFVSIVFVLLCSLGPLSALLPGSEDSQLPACCRRHGAHHCTMAAEQSAGGGHVITAPTHCPQYHRGSPARVGVFAPTTDRGTAQTLEAGAVITATRTVTLHRARTSTNRGPPALL